MTKYSEQFKLKVVEQYLQGTAGYKTIGKPLGVDDKAVKRWVTRYRIHGKAGLAKKFSHYSAEFKLSVLQHMWLKELSFGQVSAQFDIRNPGAVGQWERCYHSGGLDALAPRKRGRPKNMPIPPDTKPGSLPDPSGCTHDELIVEVNQLRMEVAYLKKLQALVQAQQQQRTIARKKRK